MTSKFLRISIYQTLCFACVTLHSMMLTSLNFGRATNHAAKASIINPKEWCVNKEASQGMFHTLALRSMNVQMKGELTARTHVVVKTRSLRFMVKISKTSLLTVSSKASWLPNQIFTHSLTTSLSQSIDWPDGLLWFWSQHELLVVSKDIANSCCFMIFSCWK